MDRAPKLVVSIAGNWRDKNAVIQNIVAVDAAYQFEAAQLTNDRLRGRWKLEFEEEEDPFLQIQLSMQLTSAEREDIGEQTRLASLIADGGSEDSVRQVTQVACDLLRAGGFGVNIQSSGKTFGRQQWLDAMGSPTPEALHEAYVGTIDIELDRSMVSCGMRNFGLPDGLVPDAMRLHGDQAMTLLQAFSLHLLKDRPLLWDGDTFSMEPSRTYHMRKVPCTQFEEDDLLFNPYGYWAFSSQ